MKKSNGEKVFNIINILFLLLLAAVMLYPYVNTLAISFNDSIDSSLGGITVYPRMFTLNNYMMVLKNSAILQGFIVSVSRSFLGTVLALAVTAGAAYAMTKKYLPGRKGILFFFTIPLFISGGLIPMFILFRYIHFINNYLVYIIPAVFSVYNMHIIRTYFIGIPISLEESALIDGANEALIFFKIMIPLSKPVLATIALWLAVGHWNDWTTTLYFVQNERIYTLQYLLMKLVRESDIIQKMISEAAMKGMNTSQVVRTTPQSLQATTLIIVTLPIVITYPFLQKYFVQGVLIGSVKE